MCNATVYSEERGAQLMARCQNPLPIKIRYGRHLMAYGFQLDMLTVVGILG